MQLLDSKQFKRFKSIRRGYVSAIIMLILLISSCFAELLVNNRALLVSYQGQWYFPTYGAIHTGKDFGLDYDYQVNYRQLQEKFKQENRGDWVLMPLVPYGPFETDFKENEYPPYPPSFNDKHYLGSDTAGRDVVARLFYGFRTAIAFSLVLLFGNYIIGVSLGCLMGYWGGTFDLFIQRLIEIWSNVPFLYVIMILASIIVPNFWMLIIIMLAFGWMGMTWYMRTATYKEKARDYVMAAQTLGASSSRIIFKHILPNTISVIVTFIPFSVISGISSLTALDYLGFGLPPPTPSWGELLRQGTDNLDSIWIVMSVVVAMTLVLTMVTFIGEAIREAFDPKRHTYYE